MRAAKLELWTQFEYRVTSTLCFNQGAIARLLWHCKVHCWHS